MSSKLVLVGLVLCIAAVFGQAPKPCETPDLWEARHFTYDHLQQEQSRGALAYDAKYQRMRTIEEFQIGREEDAFDTLRLYAQNIEYRYSFKEKTCKKLPLTREWRNFGIPSNAKSIGEFYIGSSGVPNAGVLTTMWEDEFQSRENKTMYYLGVFTYEACLPVKIEVYERPDRKSKGLAYHDVFFDIIPGTRPDAFVPRKECQGL
jgi:hypothetical protein